MIQQPVLVYSKFCKYSNEFVQLLSSKEELLNVFLPLLIDPDNSGKRPANFYSLQNFLKQTFNKEISSVPTVILPSQDGNLILLTGDDAFSWIENVTGDNQSKETKREEQEKQQQEVIGINPNEMMCFSDSYAPLNGSLNSASSQSFQFLNEGFQRINTLDEEVVSNKEKFCQDKYERLLKEREEQQVSVRK